MRFLLFTSCLMVVWPAFSQVSLPEPALLSTTPPNLPVLAERSEKPEEPAAVAPFTPVGQEVKPEEKPVELVSASATAAEPAKDNFKDALISAYKNHPALKAEREALAAIDENVAQAVSEFRPNVEAGYSRGRQRRATGGGSWNYQDTTAKTLDVDQSIFNGGESWANYKSAKDRVKAGRARLQEVEQQVLYDAVVAYTDVVEKQDVLKLNQNNVDVLKRQLEATVARFDAGELTRTDVAQSEARLAKAKADERQALGDVDVARATFKRVIGFDPTENMALPVVPGSLPTTMNEAIDIAQANNPSLIAAKHDESAADTDIDARAGAILPDVNIRGAMARTENGNIPSISKLDSDSITLNVTVPLYQSGAEWSRLRQARNVAQQAKYISSDTQDAVIESVTRAWQDFVTAKAVITSNEEALQAAEAALEGVRQENQFGVRTILDVLDAEQEAFSTRVNLVKAERVEKVQAYRLLATVGKLTATNLELGIPVYDPKEHYDNVKYQLLGL